MGKPGGKGNDMTQDEAKAALDLPIPTNDAGAETVREYFKELLATVLVEEESFSGKRPFGNSGWQHEFLTPLEDAGYIQPGARGVDLAIVLEALVDAL